MQISRIGLGQKQTLQVGPRLEATGIFKLASSQPAMLTELGLNGDFICDAENHGGPDQAVYIYGEPDYAWWSKELAREVPTGSFGENLTVSALQSADFTIGDRLRMGEVILEVTAPRIPCSTLAARMGDPGFVKRFRHAERPGLYCRVIQAGFLQVGEIVSVDKFGPEGVSLLEVFRGHYDKDQSENSIRRQLNAPIAIRARIDLQEKLQKLLTQA